MAAANYDLDLTGSWLFHLGAFERFSRMAGNLYHASSKAGGALLYLEGFGNEDRWRPVVLPHDWVTDLPVDQQLDATPGCRPRGTAWYKKKFFLPDTPIEWAELVFDGVLGQCTVYVNGVTAARNFSGYNRFSTQVEDYLLPGKENEIAVFVDARRHEGWWYEGAGIYRPVRLLFRGSTHLLPDDCFVRTQGDTLLADIRFTGSGRVRAVLRNPAGQVSVVAEQEANGCAAFCLRVDRPARWSPEVPALYTLELSLEKDGQVADGASFPVGFRDVEWVSGRGMYLNGSPYRLRGICVHQDHGGLGAAVYPDVEEYRILRLKSLGANAYRCAHHGPSETLLEICDRLGMLVMVENRHFDVSADTLGQVDALVKISRNHPCVLMYSLFNEEPWQSEPRGRAIAEKLRSHVRGLDDTRAVTGSQNAGVLLAGNAAEALDVIGINYNLDAYGQCHVQNPEKLILGTENSPTFATRGHYRTDRVAQIFADDGSQYPFDFSQPLHETMAAAEAPYVAGCFVWSGFDHRGEPNPFEYPSISSHWGVLDLCGFDKNTAQLLRAYYLQEPFLRLAAFGDAPREGLRHYMAYTNAQAGELFLNGRSLGIRQTVNRTLTWEAPAEAGTLQVIAWKDGRELRDSRCSPGEAARLCVTDVNPRGAAGTVRILNAAVTDAQGIPVLSAKGLLRIRGRILGVSNGDPRGHHHDKTSCLPLFGGKAQIITPRTGTVTLTYADLPPVTIGEPGDDQ